MRDRSMTLPQWQIRYYLCLLSKKLGLDLVTHGQDSFVRGTNEGDVVLAKSLGEMVVFGQESVARVDSLSACIQTRLQDAIHIQVTLSGRCRAHANSLRNSTEARCGSRREHVYGNKGKHTSSAICTCMA